MAILKVGQRPIKVSWCLGHTHRVFLLKGRTARAVLSAHVLVGHSLAALHGIKSVIEILGEPPSERILSPIILEAHGIDLFPTSDR